MPRPPRATRWLATVAVAAGLAASGVACGGSAPPAGAPAPAPVPSIRPVAQGTGGPSPTGPTRSPSPFHVLPGAVVLPNPSLTPGETYPGVTTAQVCSRRYTTGVRQPHLSAKRRAFESYGLDYADHLTGYTLDHLVPLSLGGDNGPKNLWPQPLRGPAAAALKAAVEVRLHDLVCAHQVTLRTAQLALSTSWWTAYRHWGAVPAARVAPPPVTVTPGEVRNGLACRTSGATGTTPVHVSLTCRRSPDGTLRWGKRS